MKDTKDTSSDAQINELNDEVPCVVDNPKSVGLNLFEFICRERLAATEVSIKWAGVATDQKLAEVVVAGKTWGELCYHKSEINLRRGRGLILL